MEQIGAFLPLILIFGVFYILLIRPQQKKIKVHREMINNLRRGDKIITSGGIIGSINKVNENKELFVEISDNVEIKIAPGMVTDLYSSPETKNKNQSSKDQPKDKSFTGFFNKKKNN
tara:strand:+ start:1555 stop:1905 length:351 start_codon:yes stop_codon:yes gene_type:complete